jgi:hypothetical protein
MISALRAFVVAALLVGAGANAFAETTAPTVTKKNFVFSAGVPSKELDQIGEVGSGGKVFAGVLYVILRGKDDAQIALPRRGGL